jgi:hypothetical protein
MKKYSIFCLVVMSIFSCSSAKNETKNTLIINETINLWHTAASKANFDEYFNLMTKKSVFVGTDATENWQIDAFKAFSKPYFDKGKAWSFKPLKRSIYFSENQKTAWFDELLDTQMKICRGSGVLIKENGKWKIAHYVLSMTIPNEKTNEVVKIKDQIETNEINLLKTK